MAARENRSNPLVDSLTNLVNAAKGVIEGVSGDSCGTKGNELRKLYPSIRGEAKERSVIDAFPSSSTSTSSSTAKQPDTPTLRQYPMISAEKVWGGDIWVKRKFSRKSSSEEKQPKKEKVLETMKDVFLIDDPTIEIVPRKGERQYFYQNDLVASAVKFSSNMTENDIRWEIMNQFPQYSALNFPDFEFFKSC